MVSYIPNICLWLDALDSTTFTLENDRVLEWRDKSSNAARFVPVRDGFRPVFSTNAVIFSPSSFQLRSVNKLPAYSTTDIFFVMNYEPLKGPRQPFFDSADITPSETDNRLNVQVYADGYEYYRGCPTPSTTLGAVSIYKGDLYLGTNVTMSPNYLQKYDRMNEQFNFLNIPMTTPNIRGMAVYDGNLYMAGGNTVERFDGATMTVANLLSSTTNTPIVYNENLFVTTRGFITTGSNAASRPQLYRWNTLTSNFDGIAQMQAFLTATVGIAESAYNSIDYAGTLYFFNSNSQNNGPITRLEGNTYNSNSLVNTLHYGTGLFRGFLLNFRNEARLHRYTEAGPGFMTWARTASGQFVTGLASCAYKGDMYFLRNQASGTNTIEYTGGDGAGSSSNSILSTLTATATSLNTNSLMVVHDGKLFVNNANAFNIVQYGNGTSLDFPISSGQMIVMVRKTQEYAQVWINGTIAFETLYNFEFNRQPTRHVYVGGAAGTLCSAVSDPGTDHIRGSIQSVLQFSGILNETDRQTVESELAWSFNLGPLLPPEHPFNNSNDPYYNSNNPYYNSNNPYFP
jgi:hypothetical protein